MDQQTISFEQLVRSLKRETRLLHEISEQRQDPKLEQIAHTLDFLVTQLELQA